MSVSRVLRHRSLIPGILAIALLFSGEEGYGKYLDLYANHTAYNNLKNIGKRPGYLQYLDILLAAQIGPVHSDLPKETRLTKDFETYVFFDMLGTFLLIFKLLATSKISIAIYYLSQRKPSLLKMSRRGKEGLPSSSRPSGKQTRFQVGRTLRNQRTGEMAPRQAVYGVVLVSPLAFRYYQQ